jgi:HTH-type transcriptional regulator / antitoxin HigA
MEQDLQEQKTMNALTIDAAAIAPAWKAFQTTLPVKIGNISSEREFKRVVKFMNGLLDVVGDDERHELAGLLDVVGQFVEEYETTHHAIPDTEPREVLRFLLEQNGLTQSDLAVEIGGQSVVSSILSGRRSINARQAKALAERFGVSAAVFL